MFGHDDKQKDDENQDEAATSTAADQVINPDEQTDSSGDADDSWQHPGPPPSDDDDSSVKTDDFTAGQEADDNPGEPLDKTPETAHTSDFGSAPATSPAGDGAQDDLIDIKQNALGKLTPLIGHLDQAPDEKFRTLMMMIQASDDQSLVRQAYETALEIEDEKSRAQALLDIVNEINYFTQNPSKPE